MKIKKTCQLNLRWRISISWLLNYERSKAAQPRPVCCHGSSSISACWDTFGFLRWKRKPVWRRADDEVAFMGISEPPAVVPGPIREPVLLRPYWWEAEVSSSHSWGRRTFVQAQAEMEHLSILTNTVKQHHLISRCVWFHLERTKRENKASFPFSHIWFIKRCLFNEDSTGRCSICCVCYGKAVTCRYDGDGGQAPPASLELMG